MHIGLAGKDVEFVVFSDVDWELFAVQFDQSFFLDLKSKLQKCYEVYIKPPLTSD